MAKIFISPNLRKQGIAQAVRQTCAVPEINVEALVQQAHAELDGRM